MKKIFETKKIRWYALITTGLFLGGFLFSSCEQQILDSRAEVKDASITRNSTLSKNYIPFADSATLASFNNDKEIINSNLARKLALIELEEAGFRKEQKWEGCHLSPSPVIIYGFDSKPEKYEFTVQDAENKNVGTVATQARKKTGGIISEVLPEVKNYSSFFTKSKNIEMKIITNYSGSLYLGLVGKAGESPETVIDPSSGEIVPIQSEYNDDEIFKMLSDSLIEADKRNKEQISLIQDASIREMATKADSVPVQQKIEMLKQSLIETKEGRDAYWNIVNQYSDSISVATDEEIINKSSKSLFSFIKRLFDFKNDDPKYIEKYRNNLMYMPTGYNFYTNLPWCGPWAMDWVYNTNFHKEKYNHFESYAGTIGLGGGSYLISALSGTKPMFPSEMCLSMSIASIAAGKMITVSPCVEVGQWDGYYHVRDSKKPILILTESFSHWIVAYGTKTTGTYAWRNYYYAVCDNSHYVRPVNRTYSNPKWYAAPWFIIYVRIFD